MKTFDQIIQDKKNGIDCTEYESAFVKQVIKNLEKYFPNEFDEAIEEMQGEMLFS